MSIGSDLNDESVKENQDSNGNEKEQQVTAAIVNEKVERSSVKAASASTTVELSKSSFYNFLFTQKSQNRCNCNTVQNGSV